jgi:hypothetical protein
VNKEGVEQDGVEIESIESIVPLDQQHPYQPIQGAIPPLDSRDARSPSPLVLSPQVTEDEGLGKSPLVTDWDWDLEVDAVT